MIQLGNKPQNESRIFINSSSRLGGRAGVGGGEHFQETDKNEKLQITPNLAILQLQKIERSIPKEHKSMRLAADFEEPWQILISTMLSAQTRDETTIPIAEELFKKYPSPKKLSQAKLSDIKKIIKKVNFYKTKAKNVLATSKMISERGLSNKIEELIKFPGVGRKTANVFLAVAHKKPAIGVDTHVAFLSGILGWTKNKDKHKIEKDLENLFPRNYWISINYILVRFGRVYSTRKKQVEKLRELGIIK